MSSVSHLQRILFAIAGGLIALDACWGVFGGFRVDVATYLPVMGMGLVVLAAGIFYQTRRPDPKIAAMLMGASFLVLFSGAANLLNNYLMTVAGSRIDAALDRYDRALGFDWYRLMLAMSDHPFLNGILFQVYRILLPEIALLLVVLSLSGQIERAYRMCLAVALGALMVIGLWAWHPSFGAMSLYQLPPDIARRLVLAITCEFGHAQVALLEHGPGLITPDPLHGSLIGFPSFHCILALVICWSASPLKRLRWPLWVANALVIVSTPIQGGHHLVDVLAAFPVAGIALFMARSRNEIQIPSSLVNKTPSFGPSPAPQAVFRSAMEQKNRTQPVCD